MLVDASVGLKENPESKENRKLLLGGARGAFYITVTMRLGPQVLYYCDCERYSEVGSAHLPQLNVATYGRSERKNSRV